MTRLIVGPFNRVEGDLEVRLDLAGGRVRTAEVSSPLFRGFERMLIGKPAADALVYAPRICGICSVSQSVAAARAIGAAQGLAPTANGQRAINLIHAAENIADHLTHFYLFFMPDFARDTYRGEPWGANAAERFSAIKGSAAADMLPARAAFLHIMGALAGKWPHTLSIRPGGVTQGVDAATKARLAGILHAFRRFLERHLFGGRLEDFAALATPGDLAAWASRHGSADAGRYLAISAGLDLANSGVSGAGFMSYGAYPGDSGALFSAGTYNGGPSSFDPAGIAEDTAHSWYEGDRSPRAPHDGVTTPGGGDGDGYTWCKAPRLVGRPMEVGALARQLANGHPLIRAIAAKAAGVHARIVARLLEIALVTMAMQQWVEEIEPGEPFIRRGRDVDAGRGMGLTEAARGSLGHWLTLSDGRIANYQIIAPTTWNFSPRDADGRPGPLESALVGAPVRAGETTPVSVQHIVRSFDPCMVCTVH